MRDCQLEPPREQAPPDHPAYHEWTVPDDPARPWMTFHRVADGFLLRFPGLCDFRVSGDGRAARCAPVPGTSEGTCLHLYLNQVRPLMQGRQGKLVFHASAVALGEAAVAFVGESGRGKSTLAAAFAASGAPFLTDDGLVLEPGEGGFRVLPSHPSIRLRDDSRAALMGDGAEDDPGAWYAGKLRLPAEARLPHSDRAMRLGVAYVLGSGETREVSLTRLGGTEALVEWMRHAFLIDPEDRPALAAHFAGVTGLADAVPCYRLDFPRRFGDLASVRRAIVAHADAVRAGR